MVKEVENHQNRNLLIGVLVAALLFAGIFGYNGMMGGSGYLYMFVIVLLFTATLSTAIVLFVAWSIQQLNGSNNKK